MVKKPFFKTTTSTKIGTIHRSLIFHEAKNEMKRSLTSFTCEFLIGIFLGIRATELDRRRRRRRRANGRGEMESRRGEIGGSQCMFTLSGVFAKSCFIDGGLEGSSRTLDTAEEAEAKNQACVLHYKFSPLPQYTPAYRLLFVTCFATNEI